MAMEKRVLLGVRKKKHVKRTKKSLFNKVVDYLKSDCYMFAPLISSPPFDLFVPNIASSAATGDHGVETEKPLKELVKEYSKYDCYMYASMLVPQSSDDVRGTPCSGPAASIPTRVSTKKSNQSTKQAENVTVEIYSTSKDRSCEIGIASEQVVGHRETMKHLAHNAFPYNLTGDKAMELQALKSIVE